MKILVAEDDVTSRLLLQKMLGPYGAVQVATDGREAVELFREALIQGEPFDLVCLDIMMPEMSGQDALREIRALEGSEGTGLGKGARIMMTTSLKDRTNVMDAFRAQCDAYLVKPIQRAKLVEQLRDLGMAA